MADKAAYHRLALQRDRLNSQLDQLDRLDPACHEDYWYIEERNCLLSALKRLNTALHNLTRRNQRTAPDLSGHGNFIERRKNEQKRRRKAGIYEDLISRS